MNERSPRSFSWPWSASSIAAGLLSFIAFLAYGKLHWTIVHMIRDKIPITEGLRILAALGKPGSVFFAVLSVVLYLVALRQEEPTAARCFALACAVASCMTIPLIT